MNNGILTLKEAQKIMKKNGGYLDLSGTQITALPDNLTVGGWLGLRGTQITALPDNLTVGGYLGLRGTQITALPDNLTVGGWLDLSDTQITALPDNLTVGGSLGLRGTQITALPDNLTVGGSLDLRGTQITSDNHKQLRCGDYVPGRYLYADGILTHVKGCKKIDGYIYYQGKIKGRNVVSDGTHYAHCKSLRDGIADLIFKAAAERGAGQYKGLTLDSVVKTEDAINMYRVITGACRQGTQRFLDNLGKLKESYAVREIIDITRGQYGAERLQEFFEGGQK